MCCLYFKKKKKKKNPFFRPVKFPPTLLVGSFLFLPQSGFLCRGRGMSFHILTCFDWLLFWIDIMTFTGAIITLVRDASNLRIFDLSSTWGEDSECIFPSRPFATVIQFKSVGITWSLQKFKGGRLISLLSLALLQTVATRGLISVWVCWLWTLLQEKLDWHHDAH